MANLTLAINYLRQNAKSVELARLERLLNGTPAPAAVLEEFEAAQREDGGWAPFWAPGYSSIDATCYRLAQLEALGVSPDQSLIERGLAFLVSRQGEDGYWEEETSVRKTAPPWAKPGDKSARLYLTANAGYWMSLWAAGQVQSRRAAEILSGQTKRDGRLRSFAQANWLAKPLWSQEGFKEQEEAVTGYLTKRVPDLPAANLAWLANALIAAATPPDDPLLTAAVGRLAWLQAPDGHWHGEADQDAHTTLEALRALKYTDHP